MYEIFWEGIILERYQEANGDRIATRIGTWGRKAAHSTKRGEVNGAQYLR